MCVIRKETPEDYEAITEVLRLSFPPAPQQAAEEKEPLREWTLVKKIRNCSGYRPELSLVAVVDDKIVGYIMFNHCTIGADPSAALAPLGVHPDYQQQGIGSALVKKGLELTKQQGYKSSIVLGSPYYTKFGYLPIPPAIHLAEGLDRHLYMIEFEPGTIAGLAGQVQYCSPFYDTDGNLL